MPRNIKNILVHSIHDRELEHCASKYLSGRLIDIGCGSKPYKTLLSNYVSEYIGVDHEDTMHDKSNIDIFATAYNIPLPSESFDCAICIAVLEHLEEPEMAIRECHRLVKQGGIAIYSAPFIWHLHEEPRDFFRYSKYGLQYLFEKVGFEIVKLKALSGFCVTFGQHLVYNIYRYNRGILRHIPVIPALGLTIQGLCYLLNKIDKTEQWTWAYFVVAKKI